MIVSDVKHLKVLTFTEPFATLIAIGAKTIDTRSWSTRYRGPLAIHTAQRFPRSAQHLCAQEPFASSLQQHGFGPGFSFSRGAIIALVTLNDCLPTTEIGPLSDEERAFGDFRPGRFAWRLTLTLWLPYPVFCKGTLGLWTPPPFIERTLLAALVGHGAKTY